MAGGLLMLCNTLSVGGAERHWVALAAALAERGLPVAVETLRAAGPLAPGLRAAGVSVTPGAMASSRDVRGLVRSMRTSRQRPSTVMTLGTAPGVVGQVLAWRGGARHFVNFHQGPGIRLNSHERVVQRAVLRTCHHVIAASAAQLPALKGLGVADDRVTVIPNGVDPAAVQASASRAEIRAGLGIAAADVLVLMLGALRREKRADLFVAAVDAAHARDPRVRGRIAGPGNVPVDGTATILLGRRSDVGDLLHAADLLALTSDHEALPLAVLEAMAAGVPVVATAVGGICDVIDDGVTGLLVAPGDVGATAAAILRLAADEDLRARLAQAARARVAVAFSWEGMVDGYMRALAPAWRDVAAGLACG